jgi:hypothetical protein
MNSLLGGRAGNIFMQAFGAMIRGENPRQFMQNLAQTNPALKGMDFNNMEKTAQDLCNKKGVNMQDKLNEIQNMMPK